VFSVDVGGGIGGGGGGDGDGGGGGTNRLITLRMGVNLLRFGGPDFEKKV